VKKFGTAGMTVRIIKGHRKSDCSRSKLIRCVYSVLNQTAKVLIIREGCH